MTSSEKRNSWEIISASRKARPAVPTWKGFSELPPTPICFPIKGSAGKTGAWRTFRPVVDHSKCIQCYFCYMYCPEGTVLVDPSTKQVDFDLDFCKGCGICAMMCPKKCITMEKELK